MAKERILGSGLEADARAAVVIRRGGLIVYPTDTVYGLGCDPMDALAVARLFRAKGRGMKAVPVLCADLATAESFVVLGQKARELAKRHWPGALTLVAPLSRKVPEQLHRGGETLGVRVPGSPSCLRLIRACGGALVGTSANLSGKPSARTALQAVGQLGSMVDLYIDGGRLRGAESTVVKVVDGDIIILRKGSVRVTEKRPKR